MGRARASECDGGTNLAAYQYDASWRRAQNTLNGLMTWHLYDGLNPVQELNGASPPVATANMLTGLNIDEYFQRVDSNALSYLTDMLDSTLALADSGGNLNTTYTYEPFGNTTISGSSGNPYQFTGRENDDTGLYFYRARYYSPTFQRFIAQDPIGFGGGDPNAYNYVSADPVNAADPRGLQAVPAPAPAPIPVPLPPVFIPGTPANRQFTAATLNLLHELADKIPTFCQTTKKDYRCKLKAEVTGPSGTTCAYVCKGYGALATFPKPSNMTPCPEGFDGMFPGPWTQNEISRQFMAARRKHYDDAFRAYEAGDYGTAHRMLKQFAMKGDAAAQTALGSIYELGLGDLPIDLDEAVKWYTLASAQGNGVASNNLGTIALLRGDREAAMQWYAKARQQGFAHSPATLAPRRR
jgi:RHS repeat-associated protein